MTTTVVLTQSASLLNHLKPLLCYVRLLELTCTQMTWKEACWPTAESWKPS